ncbi:hypothetical protein ACU4GD_18345 [Cupriavidus basilensis]
MAQNLYRHGERTLGVMPLYPPWACCSLLAMALVDGLVACVCGAGTCRAGALGDRRPPQISCLSTGPPTLRLPGDLHGH